MVDDKLVSVVIPTFKRDKEFKRALQSIVKQTYTQIEIIVIDDNIDAEYSEKILNIISECSDDRIIYHKNKSNLGGALSRNKGIELSKGEFIAFLDDDDCYVSHNIAIKLEKFRNSKDKNLALVYGWAQSRDDRNKQIVDYRNTVSGCCIYEAMLDCQAATSQWMCKKSALIDVGMFSDVPSKQDSTLMIKLMLKQYTIDYIPEILSYYYQHKNFRISMGNIKNLEGELLLRSFIRDNYSILGEEQIDNIEYSISVRILKLAIKNKQAELEKKEFDKLFSQNKKIIFNYLKWYFKYRILSRFFAAVR